MDIIEPNFQINVNCNLDYIEFGSAIRIQWTELNIEWLGTAMAGETLDNWIEITNNPRYNPKLVESEDGGFYYPYFVTVAYKHPSITNPLDVDRQISFARSMKQKLLEANYKVNVQAEFEDLL